MISSEWLSPGFHSRVHEVEHDVKHDLETTETDGVTDEDAVALAGSGRASKAV